MQRIKGFYQQQNWSLLNLEILRWLGGNVIAAFKLLKDSPGRLTLPYTTAEGRVRTRGGRRQIPGRYQPPGRYQETRNDFSTAKETEQQKQLPTEVVGSLALQGFQPRGRLSTHCDKFRLR